MLKNFEQMETKAQNTMVTNHKMHSFECFKLKHDTFNFFKNIHKMYHVDHIKHPV